MTYPIAQILFPNRLDEATLAGGSWMAGAPLANLLDRVLQHFARSSDTAAASSQFTISLKRARQLNAVVLLNHNFTVDATFRIIASNSADLSFPVYDSGVVQAYPAQASTLQLGWNFQNWWSGKPPIEDSTFRIRNSILIFPASIFARYVQVQMVDAGNPAGYVQLGRVFLGASYQPDHNYNFGASIGVDDPSTFLKSLGGTKYFDERPKLRTQTCSFDSLDQSKFGDLFDLIAGAGQTKEVFWIPDATDLLNQVRRCFLGTIRDPSKIEEAALNRLGTSFVIEELI